MKLIFKWLAVYIILALGFHLSARAQGFKSLHNFASTPDGANPKQLIWTNGFFYGATANGGANGYGMIYKFDTNGSFISSVYDFTGATNDGSSPNKPLIVGNTIYGTTTFGGTNNEGMIFSVNVNGTSFKSLYSFSSAPDGSYPLAGLVLNGTTLYGVAQAGGTNSGGVLFKINTDGTGYGILHWFTNSPDGYSPQSSLVLNGSTLYGTTAFGGSTIAGTVYSINVNGTGYTILRDFTNSPDGEFPYGGLILDSETLYGTTGGGGSNNTGTIFAMDTGGNNYKILHQFADPNGSLPRSSLFLDGGMLYGTASSGGDGGGGTIFKLNVNGSGFTVLKKFFSNGDSGNSLESGVELVSNTLWSTTYSGGTYGDGTLYSLQFSPIITVQPQSVSVASGNSVSFTVTATDESALTYQWYFNTNGFLSGQTNSQLEFVSNNNAGTYTVVVSDNYGAVTSSPAVLTITTGGSKPTITSQPQSISVTSGSAANFSVSASGDGTLGYQWYMNTNTLLNGQTANTLHLASVGSGSAGAYTVVVNNSFGTTTSGPAILTVIPSGSKPTITLEPQSISVTNGFAANFSVSATGTGTLGFQWYFNTNTLLSGQTASTLHLASVGGGNTGAYTVAVNNNFGAVTSSPAILTVIPAGSKPTITSQPQSVSVTNGYLASFSVTATGTGTLGYQWYFNTNTLLLGQNASTLNFPNAISTNVGAYTVAITNNFGAVTSSPATLAVSDVSGPIIVNPLQNLTVGYGDTASLSVTAVGQSPLFYKWYSNTVPVQVFSAATLQKAGTDPTLAVTATFTNISYYFVLITNSLGRATSGPAMFTVATAPVITTNPQPLTVSSGDSASFIAGAVGAGPLNFRWYFQTTNLLSDANDSTLDLANVSSALAGGYLMVVSNSYGQATSGIALLTVQTIPTQPNFVNVMFNSANGSFTLTLTNAVNSMNRLWASPNLANPNLWQVIASNVMAANGIWLYTDTNIARTNSDRFYRASSP